MDKRRSLSLEQDMARDSSVKRGNVAALIAWQRSSQGKKTGEPQLAWAGDVVSLGIFPVHSTAATTTISTNPKLFLDIDCRLQQ